MIQVRHTSDVVNNGIKCMIYGAAGVGKTPTLATAPGIIIISGENGLLSIRRNNTPYIEIRNYKDLKDAYIWCTTSHEARQYYTLGLDSLSELMEVLLTEEKKKTRDPRKAYGEVAEQGVEMVKGFRDIPGKNVVLIAKETYDKDEVTGAMLYTCMMPGQKLGPKLPYYFDEVFRMIKVSNPATQQVQRVLCTQGNYQYVARDRSGFLSEYESPDLLSVFKKILGY